MKPKQMTGEDEGHVPRKYVDSGYKQSFLPNKVIMLQMCVLYQLENIIKIRFCIPSSGVFDEKSKETSGLIVLCSS